MILDKNIEVVEERKFHIGYTSEQCIIKMEDSFNNTIDWLDKSPYFDRKRFENSQECTIANILTSYLKGDQTFILEAPTGVGKSIIGIVVSETIRRYLGLSSCASYVLTSSKMLQDQLNDDKDHFNLKWASLKGQANYECNFNGKNFLERDCKDMSISKAMEIRTCAENCKYIIDRKNAMSFHTAILSYAYWLTTMNFVYAHLGQYAPFQKREVVIMDECHMLGDIVMNMFQNKISDKFIGTLKTVHECILNSVFKEEIVEKSLQLQTDIKEILVKLLDEKISIAEMFEYLTPYYEKCLTYSKLLTLCCNKYLPNDVSTWNVYQRKLELNTKRVREYAYNIAYFINENIDYQEYVVKTYEKDAFDSVTMTLRSLREAEMIREHVHKFCNFQLCMSATIGDADVYAKTIGVEKYSYMYLESTFDYSKSPINHVGPPISLAYKDKAKNMDELMWRILHICEDMHPSQRGIIHTGNFEICKNLRKFVWDNSNTPRRYLFYNDSTQKAEAIKKLEKNPNAVIIGPSLLEGLDLKDDYARFLIFAKVPYPPLDEFNSRKMKLDETWYGWKTMTNVMQGLGRGVRHKKDWCISYLMDSCFEFLFAKTRTPKYISSRFAKINVGNIKESILNALDETSGLFNYSENKIVAAPVKQETEQKQEPAHKQQIDDKEDWDDLPF